MTKVILMGVVLLLSQAVAQDIDSKPLQHERQQLFEKRKALEEQSHTGRIAILQGADNCIKGASTPQSYKECEQKENAARQKLKEQQKPQLKELQQERKVLLEKAMKMRSDRTKNKPMPQGTIATH
jgi:hypothetical protein